MKSLYAYFRWFVLFGMTMPISGIPGAAGKKFVRKSPQEVIEYVMNKKPNISQNAIMDIVAKDFWTNFVVGLVIDEKGMIKLVAIPVVKSIVDSTAK